MTHYYQGTNVTPVPDDMAVRVNLEFKKKHIRTRGEAVEGDGTLQANLSGTIVTAAPGESFAFTGDAGAVVAAKVVGGVRQELGIFPSVSLTWSGLANVVAKNGRSTRLVIAIATGPSRSCRRRIRAARA